MKNVIKLKRLFSALTSLWLISSQSFAGADGYTIGLIIAENNKQLLITTKKNITKLDSIVTEYMSNGQVKCCVKINTSQISNREITYYASDEANNNPVYSYTIDTTMMVEKASFIGISYIGKDIPIQDKNSKLNNRHLKLLGKAPIDIYLCLSQEGIHLYTSKKSNPNFHIYYNLNYEVTPTCPDYIYSLN